MKIAYGPPGAVGVKSLQYVGDSESADYISSGLHRLTKPIGALSLGAWVYALINKNEKLKRQTLAISLAAFVIHIFSKEK